MMTTKQSPAADAGSDQGAGCGAAPHRVRLSRRKGYRMPENTVKVDRSNKMFGNPFRVCPRDADGIGRTRAQAVWAYEGWLGLGGATANAIVAAAKRELRGKNLACWCALDQRCHADVLLRIADTKDEPHNNPPDRSAGCGPG